MSVFSDIGKVVSITITIAKMIPAISAAMVSAEAVYQGAEKSGSYKLAMVHSVLAAVFTVSGGNYDEIKPYIDKTISGLVSLYNGSVWPINTPTKSA